MRAPREPRVSPWIRFILPSTLSDRALLSNGLDVGWLHLYPYPYGSRIVPGRNQL
jgi:hypothetical protein